MSKDGLKVIEEAMILTEDIHSALKRVAHFVRYSQHREDSDDLYNRVNKLYDLIYEDFFIDWVYGNERPTNLKYKKKEGMQELKMFFRIVQEREDYLGYRPSDRQISAALPPLTAREVSILRMRFNQDGTLRCIQKVVAEHFNISQSRVREIIEKSIRKMGRFYEQKEIENNQDVVDGRQI